MILLLCAGDKRRQQHDIEQAKEYWNDYRERQGMEAGDQAALLEALRNVTEARGGIARVAADTGLNREALYRTLSRNGNPQLASLTLILRALGLRLGVSPVKKAAQLPHAK